MNPWMVPDDRYYYGWYREPSHKVFPDGDIKSQAVERLRHNAHTKDHQLKVDVKAGVVILRGQVDTRLAKRAAGDDCWDIDGVRDVSNLLVVDGSPDADGAPEPDAIGVVMTEGVVSLPQDAPVASAASLMRDYDVGSVVVTTSGGDVVGIVTDRDLAIRHLADNDRMTDPIGPLASPLTVWANVSDPVGEVVEKMAMRRVRRVPVVHEGALVGIVSLGDLARRRDPESALGAISAAPPTP